MPTEAQRAAMLAAMGIDVYRLRGAAVSAPPMRIAVDAQRHVQAAGIDGESAERLLALLPAALGIARERVRRDADTAADAGSIEIDPSALHGNGAARRALWQSLKPLVRRLHGNR